VLIGGVADTHLTQDYFREVHRLHTQNGSDAAASFYSCPIIFDRNANETPTMVRCADLMWAFAGLSTMHPDAVLAIPTSVYSVPLVLAEKVGGWDGDATAIGEDMHMLLKCYFETGGAVQSRVVYSAASQCNISGNPILTGWRRTFDISRARYRQALRHMWGSLDTGYAIRKSFAGVQNFHFASSRRQQRFSSFFRKKQLALTHLLWEAHFLPAHLTIILLFSVAYPTTVPESAIHPTLAWAFWFTGLLRTITFLWMNVCISLYDRWYTLSLNARMRNMEIAGLLDTGSSPRAWWHRRHLLERICFPVAGTLFGSIPGVQAVVSHFWTDRLVYRVSKKPIFAASSIAVAGV
jgi:Glycosyl transferase family group 2